MAFTIRNAAEGDIADIAEIYRESVLNGVASYEIEPPGLDEMRTRFAAITQLGARLTCEGTVTELLEEEGERRARLALTTKDQAGEIKLAGEAIIAL